MKAPSRLTQFNASDFSRPLRSIIEDFSSTLSGLHRSQSYEINEQVAGEFHLAFHFLILRFTEAYDNLLESPVEAMHALLDREYTAPQQTPADSESGDLVSDPADHSDLVPSVAHLQSPTDISVDGSEHCDTVDISGVVETLNAYTHFGAYQHEFVSSDDNNDRLDIELPLYKLTVSDNHLTYFEDLLKLASKNNCSGYAFNSSTGFSTWVGIMRSACERYELKTKAPLSRNKQLIATSMLTHLFIRKVSSLFCEAIGCKSYSADEFLAVIAELKHHDADFEKAITLQLQKLVYACLHRRFLNLEVTDWLNPNEPLHY